MSAAAIKVGDKAVWTSAKGYSKPGEIVTVQEIRHGYQYQKTGPLLTIVQILSAPDNDEEKRVSPDGLSQWVPLSELTAVQMTAAVKHQPATAPLGFIIVRNGGLTARIRKCVWWCTDEAVCSACYAVSERARLSLGMTAAKRDRRALLREPVQA